MRPRWRVTSLATTLAIVSMLGANGASAQQTGGEITVDPTGTFNRQGLATISGSYVCEPTEDFTFISGIRSFRRMLEGADEATAGRALDAVRNALAERETSDGVALGSSAWVVSARH